MKLILALTVAMLGAFPGVASSASIKCTVTDFFQLSDSGRFEAIKHMPQVGDVFYVDTVSGKVTGGPMSTDGWGEIKVYGDGKRESLTIISFTKGTDTARGVRALYVSWKRSNNKHPFQISDGPSAYSGACDAPAGGL